MMFIKAFSRQSFIFMFIFGLVVLAAAAAGFHFGFQWLCQQTAALASPDISAAELAGKIAETQHAYLVYLAAGVGGLLIFCGLVTWLVLRGMARRLYGRAPSAATGKKKAQADGSVQAPAASKIQQQRLFLHLLAVLQREGRLVDFFSEDLDAYEDDQIGAAVRGIQQSCKKVIAKTLALEAVIDGIEGEAVTVPAGFDPGAVKLTGNVTGDPPFKGILRHKGWRTKKLELPVLSEAQDPGVIAPAEVELG